MKIDAINFNAFASNQPQQILKADETNSSLDEYDETRIAKKSIKKQPVENPIERKQGTVEDLINLQQSTEKMVQSYGFANVAEAQAATSPTQSSESSSSSAVSAVSGASTGGINA